MVFYSIQNVESPWTFFFWAIILFLPFVLAHTHLPANPASRDYRFSGGTSEKLTWRQGRERKAPSIDPTRGGKGEKRKERN